MSIQNFHEYYIKFKCDDLTIEKVLEFLGELNLRTAAQRGYLSIVTDGALRRTSQRISETGFWTICMLHNCNSLLSRIMDKLFEKRNRDLHSKYMIIREFITSSSKKDQEAGVSFNEYVRSIELTEEQQQEMQCLSLTGFSQESSVRFRSRFENLRTFQNMRGILRSIKSEGTFISLDAVDIDMALTVYDFMLPIYRILTCHDKDNMHSPGDIIHSYTNLLYYANTETRRGDSRRVLAELKQSLKTGIIEQLFSVNAHVPIRVSPADLAAVMLWPPTR